MKYWQIIFIHQVYISLRVNYQNLNKLNQKYQICLQKTDNSISLNWGGI